MVPNLSEKCLLKGQKLNDSHEPQDFFFFLFSTKWWSFPASAVLRTFPLVVMFLENPGEGWGDTSMLG